MFHYLKHTGFTGLPVHESFFNLPPYKDLHSILATQAKVTPHRIHSMIKKETLSLQRAMSAFSDSRKRPEQCTPYRKYQGVTAASHE